MQWQDRTPMRTAISTVVVDVRLLVPGASDVRHGYQPQREIQTGIGPVTVQVPKVRSRDGKPVSFHSALVPPYVRKSASLEAALPWLYLKGISTGEMAPALEVLVGTQAKGLSASTVSRLKQQWRDDYEAWRHRRLDRDRFVYVWADGIYSGLRAERERLCALVIVGVNERGEKHFLAIEDGIRESTQSWREVLLDLKSRGLKAPELAVGDGANLGELRLVQSLGLGYVRYERPGGDDQNLILSMYPDVNIFFQIFANPGEHARS
jgi:transposase-like protein